MNLKNYYQIITRMLFTAALLFGIGMKAQNAFLISFPAAPQDLTVCNGSSKLTVQLDAIITSTTGADVTIQLATGVEYVPGSVALVSTIGGLSIADNGGTANAPKFKISPASIASGNRIIFTIDRIATCAARTFALASGIFTDSVTASIGAASDTKVSSSYQVNYAILTFTQPVSQIDEVVGGTYTRTFNIKNGGNGCLAQLYLSLDNPGSGIQQTSLQVTQQNGSAITAITLTPTSTSGTTTYYTVPSTALPGGDLCFNENITITETYKVKVCYAVTNYSTGWGCDSAPANWCETKTGSASVPMAIGTPSFTGFSATRSGYVDNCTPYTETITYTNGGTGVTAAATMFNAKFRLGGGAVSSMSTFRWDYFNIQSAKIGGVPVTVVNGTANNIASIDVKDLFTTDPDGVGVGLDDIDGDGYYDDLPAGKTTTLVLTIKINCSLLTCAQEITAVYGIDGDIQYTTMCSSTVTTAVKLRSTGNMAGQIATLSEKSYAPANVSNLVPFNVRFSVGYYDISLLSQIDTSNTRYQYVITLPAGLSLSGTGNIVWRNGQFPNNASSAGTSVTATQVGNILTITSPASSFGYINLDFVYDCSVGSGGTVTIPYTLKRIDNIVTGCTCNADMWCGSNIIANVICPAPCPLGGASISLAKIERADNSLGWTNNTLSTRQARSSISSYDLSKALYLDDIDITTNGIQNTISSNNLHLKLDVSKLIAQAGDIITPKSVDVVIKRSGSTVASGNVTSFATTGSNTTDQIIDWDLSSILPGGTILAGDVIETVSHYTVSGTNFPTHDIQTGKKLYFYNNVSGSEYYCNFAVPEMYLVAPIITDAHNGGAALTASSCTVINVGSGTDFYAYRFDAGGTVFLNEVRPGFLPTRYQFTVPAGYVFDHVTNGNYGAGNLTPTSVSGSTYTFDLPAVTYPITVVNTYSTIFNVYLNPTCATPASGPIIHSRLDYVPYYYHYAGTTPLPTANIQKDLSIDYNTATKPSISITNQSGTIQASKLTESFVVRMASTGTTTAPYTWIAVPTTAGVTVTSIVDIATSTPLTLIPYSGGVWAKISTTGLSSGTYADYRIDFIYTTCTSTTFPITAGWNCSEYPTDPTAYTCGAATTNLTFIPQTAAIQINTITQPTGNINLCTPLDYEFRVNCGGAANTINNKFNIEIPNGLSIIAGTLLVEYPVGSANWQALPFTTTTTSTGIKLTIDLTAHTAYPAQGLPGTLNDGGNANVRQIGIKYSLTTDCSFTSGAYVIVSTDADNTCGQQPATGSGSLLNTSTLNVAGADPGYVLNSSVTNPNAPIVGCAGNLTLHIKQIVILSTALGTPATATVTVNYPPGYDITSTTPNCTSAFCPTFLSSGTNPLTGLGYATYSIPAGMTTGQFMEYELTFTPNATIDNGTYQAVVTTDDVINGLSCPSAPGGVCSSVHTRTSTGIYDYTLQCYCYKAAVTSGTALDTKHGITSLGRAGTANGNWPMVRKGAWTALEAKTKGFVVNRLTDAQIAAIPASDLVEGMMVYNITQDCLQINVDGTAAGWKCFNTQTCPDY